MVNEGVMNENKSAEAFPEATDIFPEGEAEFLNQERQPYRTDKLFDARKSGETYNREFFAVIRDVESRFSEIPEFIGLAPFGSYTKGYANDASDFDIYVIIDAPTRELPAVDKIITSVEEEYKQKGIKISIHKESISTENFGTENASISESTIESAESMALLTRTITGHKIGKYRELVKKKVDKMYPLKRKAFFENIVIILTELDGLSRTLEKMDRRADENENSDEFDKEKYVNARRELWEKRAHKLFGE